MKIPLQIECPHCQARLRLNNRDSLGRKFRCRACREIFIAEELDDDVDSKDDDVNSEEDDWESNTPETKTAVRKLPRIRRLPKLSRRSVAVGSVGLVLLCGMFFVPWGKVGRFASSINPLSDSPHSVLSSLESLSKDYRAHTNSVKNAKPVEKKDATPLAKANPAAKKLVKRVDDLYFRAACLRPISLEEKKELVKQHPQCMQFMETNLFVFGGEWERELWHFIETDEEVDWVNNVRYVSEQGEAVAWLISHMDVLPEPEDDVDRLELVMIDKLYEIIDYMTGINSAGDMESGVEDLAEYRKELQALNEQLEDLRVTQGAKHRGGESFYERFRNGLDDRIEKIEKILVDRYGKKENLETAIHDLKNADAVIPEHSHEEQMQKIGTRDPFDDWDVMTSQMMTGYVRTHGKKNVLFIGETEAIRHPDVDQYLPSLKKAVGKDPETRYNSGWGMMNIFITDKDPNEVAKQITGAKVVSVDAGRRQITVEPLPAKPQQWEIDRDRMKSPIERRIEAKAERLRKQEEAGIKPMVMLGPLEQNARMPLSSDFELPPMPADLRAGWLLPKSREQIIQETREKYGKNEVLVVIIPDTYFNHEQQNAWYDRMGAITTTSSYGRLNIDHSYHKDGTAYIADISEDVKEIAAAMTFAKVRSVDVENRTITVEPLPRNWGMKSTDGSSEKRSRSGKSPAPPKGSPFKPD